jgi:helicase
MEEKEILRIVVEKNKIKNFNPMQKGALEAGLSLGRNLIISSPTSSGKTLLAEIAGLEVTLNKNKKMVYLCPLVALAREKYEDFKKKYQDLGIKIALSVGNYDSSDPWLQNYDWIVASNEKMDSLIRHGAEWIEKIGLVVADEVHLLGDFSRGPTLEILLTLLKEILPQSQILAFSATISNAEEIGEWLEAFVLRSNFRPVPLYKGIVENHKIKLFGFKNYELRKDLSLEEAILENTVLMKKQLVFFVSSRKSAESLAEKLSELTFHFLEEREVEKLREIGARVERVLEMPTEQCKRLARCIRKGTAFYHSGLLLKQRSLIEEVYKRGLIKVIVSTTALAFGVNLPNFRAVVRDVKRYYPGMGSVYLPVLEIEQMFGRSGRPQFDRWGEGILITKRKRDEKELERIYIHGELEEISSKISSESALRFHFLSLISNRFCESENELISFLKKTFFGRKHDISFLTEKSKEILIVLENWGFLISKEIRENGDVVDKKISPTKIGKRISQLYLDPLTAHVFIENLKDCKKASNFTLLCLLSQAQELKPSLSLTRKEQVEIETEILENEGFFFFQIPDEFEEDYEEFLGEAKLAKIFCSWIEEEKEKDIMKKFKITPGELRSRLEISDWLLYSILEISKFIPFEKEIKKMIRKLKIRLKYGVKEELISLVSLEGVGRVRARILFEAGFKNLRDLKKASTERLTKVLKSESLAQKIKKQLI